MAKYLKSGEYISILNINNNDHKFDRDEFLRMFSKEFNDKIEDSKDKLNYQKFIHIIQGMSNKFGYIQSQSNKVTKGLWKAFYAIYVVPKRRQLFPYQQLLLDSKNEKKS